MLRRTVPCGTLSKVNGATTPRGGLQPPNTAEGTVRRLRVITIRLNPSKEQWLFLRKRASEAAAYRNKFAQAFLADALKWQVPEGVQTDKIQKHIRATERGDISSSIYVACETEVKKDWTRDGRKVMAGKRLPQYSDNNVGFATISGRPGVKILTNGDWYEASFMLSASTVEEGCWQTIPISRRTKKDEYRREKLSQFAAGEISILAARIVFKIHKGMTLVQLTYAYQQPLPVMGNRRATLSQLSDGRTLLRVEGVDDAMDYTSRIGTLDNLRTNWDGLARRCLSQAGRRRGSARTKRRLIANLGFEDKRDTLLHQWSREMANWLHEQGVGHLTVIGLVGGSWAAHRLMAMLAYKCSENGCEVIEHGEFDDPTVEHTIKHAASKASRKARKNADAARQILSNHR